MPVKYCSNMTSGAFEGRLNHPRLVPLYLLNGAKVASVQGKPRLVVVQFGRTMCKQMGDNGALPSMVAVLSRTRTRPWGGSAL